jgi:hypothetical protein
MSLEQRVEKAKKLTFVTIPNTPTATFGTWGSKDDFYRVQLTRPEKPHRVTIHLNRRQVTLENILVECLQDKGLFNEACDCQGNSKHTICYHSLGALMFAFDQRGQEIEFCRDEFVARGTVSRDEWDRAKNNSHFALIQSKQGRGSMWAVIRDKGKVVNHGEMEQRVQSMRGDEVEEEGID